MIRRRYCDLHVHSDRSDGTDPPAEIVRHAARARLAAVALTDHDTTEGVEEALDEGRRLGVRVVPGTELSLDHQGTCHVIALGIDPGHAALGELMERVRRGRSARNEAVVDRLRQLDVSISWTRVTQLAGEGVVGRPHLAQALIEAGHVRTFQEAFDRYLGRGRPGYVERERVTPEEAFGVIHAAGGAAVLCHPYTLGYDALRNPDGRRRLVERLHAWKAAGLDAIEVRYGSYSRADERHFQGLAEEIGLLPSGGSDYHGTVKPRLRVGVGRGELRIPVEWLDRLLERGRRRAAASGAQDAVT